ncbi:MAG TPA: thioredoxin [Isosphaeraceae bacterium]|jgi:thioredoxin 1|nr:thioredoxin [Isosphaeraceae bacterium]
MAGNVLEFTDGNFESEVLGSESPVLVDFWAPWCMPCRRLAPTIEKLAADYQGKVKVGKMDTDQNINTPSALRISSIPTVILFQGGREVDRLVGQGEESRFHDMLSKHNVAAPAAH